MKRSTSKGFDPAILDKLPIEKVIKKAGLQERDWYYLETRIRAQIHDMMQPVLQKTETMSNIVRDAKDSVNNFGATIEDLQMGQLRLQRYDEYFTDSTKKMQALEN